MPEILQSLHGLASLRTSLALASEGFEIGAHGWFHKHLWRLQPEELGQEVRPCKGVLEDILGKQVEMFCYPRGRYDVNSIRALQAAGYRGARTVRMLATRPTFNPFEMPTTLQVYPHVPVNYLKNVARAPSLESLQSFIVQGRRLGSWVALGKRLFDEVLKNGGIWHLERLRLWDGLRDYVCGRAGVRYVRNCALLQPQSGTYLAR